MALQTFLKKGHGFGSPSQFQEELDQGATFSADDGTIRLTDPEASNLVGIVIPAQFR
jgi:hypothetical protein